MYSGRLQFSDQGAAQFAEIFFLLKASETKVFRLIFFCEAEGLQMQAEQGQSAAFYIHFPCAHVAPAAAPARINVEMNVSQGIARQGDYAVSPEHDVRVLALETVKLRLREVELLYRFEIVHFLQAHNIGVLAEDIAYGGVDAAWVSATEVLHLAHIVAHDGEDPVWRRAAWNS